MDDIKLGRTISRFLGSENSEDQISLVNELAEVDYSKLVNYLKYSNLESLFNVTLLSIGIEKTKFFDEIHNWSLIVDSQQEIGTLIENCVFIHHTGLETNDDISLTLFFQDKNLFQKLLDIFSNKKEFLIDWFEK